MERMAYRQRQTSYPLNAIRELFRDEQIHICHYAPCGQFAERQEREGERRDTYDVLSFLIYFGFWNCLHFLDNLLERF